MSGTVRRLPGVVGDRWRRRARRRRRSSSRSTGCKATGRGVATDVVEASARAYLNAVNKIVRLRERPDRRASKKSVRERRGRRSLEPVGAGRRAARVVAISASSAWTASRSNGSSRCSRRRSPRTDAGNPRGARREPVASALVSVAGSEPLIRGTNVSKRFGASSRSTASTSRSSPARRSGSSGPNGAGKSSTMRMIGCVSPLTGGELRVLGHRPAVDGPRSAPGSAWCRRRTTSTPSSRCSTTS